MANGLTRFSVKKGLKTAYRNNNYITTESNSEKCCRNKKFNTAVPTARIADSRF